MIDLRSCRTRRALLGFCAQPHAYLTGATRPIRALPRP